jgi:uncharacterized membrane protein YjdF
MELYANFLRVGIFLVAAYAFFSISAALGSFIAFTGIFSFVFMTRKALLINSDEDSDKWELAMVALIFMNGFLVSAGLYENVPVVDIPMHLAGGLFAAWWGALIFAKERSSMSALKQFLLIVSVGVMVGAAWEGFEWLFDFTLGSWYNLPPAQPSITDVVMDLLNDTLGACVIAFLLIKQKTRTLVAK